MIGYLIDTNVISEYNREQLPHAGVVKWLDTTPEATQYVSVLTLAEIEKGILRKEEGKRRRDLQRWLDEDLPARFAGRILAFDARVASCWAHPEPPRNGILRSEPKPWKCTSPPRYRRSLSRWRETPE